MQKKDTRPRTAYVVGMDAHSRKLAISVWRWSDPWYPELVMNTSFDISNLKEKYEKLVDLDSITILEASTNSTVIKEMLDEIGYRAEVVRADTIADKERKRKVCDVKDAENLAQAYLKGDVKDFVWTPSGKYVEYRSILFAFRDAKRETQRNWNRIWSLCSANGVKLPELTGEEFVAEVREAIKGRTIDKYTLERFEMMIKDYEYYLKRYAELDGLIIEIVAKEDDMIDLMQLQGAYYKSAFAIKTIVEDARRFAKGSKLSAYACLAAQVNTSGEQEERAKKKGGSGKPLDTDGRRDLKFWFCESAQTVLNACGDSTLGKWGHRLIFRGKARNKVVCAVARKQTLYAWHIMRGDPTPNRENEDFFRRKMIRFAGDLGKARVRAAGYGSRAEFAERHIRRLYGHLPKATESEGSIQTGASSRAQ